MHQALAAETYELLQMLEQTVTPRILGSLLFVTLLVAPLAWLWANQEPEPGHRPFSAKVWNEPASTRRFRDRLLMAHSARDVAVKCDTVAAIHRVLGEPDWHLEGQDAAAKWRGDAKLGIVGWPDKGPALIYSYDLEAIDILTDVRPVLRVYLDKSGHVQGAVVDYY